MLIGYMRVSTGEQNFDPQRDGLERARCEKIYDDVCSGRATERPGLAKALEIARAGDALVVLKLDRIGRSLPHVVDLVSDLQKRGIGLKVLTGDVDTTTTTTGSFSASSPRWLSLSAISYTNAPWRGWLRLAPVAGTAATRV